ncbi:MAG TPA: tRNA (adenosine(37)-N6)-dimethylallyltransferase MiaA [Chitinophagaceae bacterium]|nr:tRNA (adenosine(37)-N6)-dimethylallyltransferase MiaA [Chitinophagaceae bacterium]
MNTCIVIAGPTAVGKTALAIAVAQHFNTSIISADSRQCFTELSIGVAKPSPEELQQVKHYFINSHSVKQDVNAAVFEQYALTTAETIFRDHDTVVMAGGTGLYIKAFCEGLDDIPGIDATLREELLQQYKTGGMNWLQEAVRTEDPVYYASGEIQNPRRLLRALEVKRATGQSIRSFQEGKTASRDFNIIKIGLDLPREQLYNNINHRVDNMMQEGLLAEVTALLPYRQLNALQTVGYKELFDYLDNTLSLDAAVDLIKTNTRRYAKRQLTWFRKDAAIKWFSPFQKEEIISSLTHSLASGG